MLSGCDTTTPCAQVVDPELMALATDHDYLHANEAEVKIVWAHELWHGMA